MRALTIAAFALAAVPGIATAQPARPRVPTTPPAISTEPPKVFVDAGYSHPDITPGMCSTISAKEVRCTIPGMTAGPYAVLASGTSTATGEGALQAIDIQINGAECNRGQSNNTAKGTKPWTAGPQTIRVACAVQVLTDQPLTVRATYDNKNATPDPKGPTLSLRRAPWPGFLGASPAGGEEDQPKPTP